MPKSKRRSASFALSSPAGTTAARRGARPEVQEGVGNLGDTTAALGASEWGKRWHSTIDVVQVVAGHCGIEELLAMRRVCLGWAGAVRREACGMQVTTAGRRRGEDDDDEEAERVCLRVGEPAGGRQDGLGPRLRCNRALCAETSTGLDAKPRAVERALFAAVVLLSSVGVPTREDQESDDVAIAAASDADVALEFCATENKATCEASDALHQVLRRRVDIAADGVAPSPSGRRLRGLINWVPADRMASGIVRVLRSAPRLRVLRFGALDGISIATVQGAVANTPLLESLRIKKFKLPDAMPSMSALLALAHLRDIDVSAQGIDAEHCAPITALLAKPTHRRLVLRDMQASTWNATLGLLAAEAAPSALTTLEVGLSQTDHTPLRPFDGAQFPGLERLIVQPQSGSIRSAAPLRFDPHCPTMPRLHSLACRTHDRDLAFLDLMPAVQHLQLLILLPGNQSVINEYCSDAGWRRLQGLTYLKDIESVFYVRPVDQTALPSMALMARPDGNRLETAAWRERSTVLGEAPLCSLAAAALALPQPHLRHFTLGEYVWPQHVPTLFTALPLLRSLTLEVAFPEGALVALEAAPHLESLSLGPCKELAHLGFRPSQLCSLKSLSLTGCPKLQRKKSTWIALSALPGLRELTLDMPERFPVAHLMAAAPTSVAGAPKQGGRSGVARTLEILRLADHTDAGPGLVHDAWLVPLLHKCQRLRRLLLHIVQTFTGASWLALASSPSAGTMEEVEVVVDDEDGSVSLEVGAFASLLQLRHLERLDVEFPEALAHPKLLLRILASTLPRLRYFGSPFAAEDGLDSDDFASDGGDDDDDAGSIFDDRASADLDSDEDYESADTGDDDDEDSGGTGFDEEEEEEEEEGVDGDGSCQHKPPSGEDFESVRIPRHPHPSWCGHPARWDFYYDTNTWQRAVTLGE